MERMQAFADDKPTKPKAEPTPAYQPDVISATYRISDEIIAEIEHNASRLNEATVRLPLPQTKRQL